MQRGEIVLDTTTTYTCQKPSYPTDYCRDESKTKDEETRYKFKTKRSSNKPNEKEQM